jgi:hypothetical protein
MTVVEVRRRGGSILHRENPFMVEMAAKTRRITSRRGDMMLVNTDTGEIQSPVAGF